MNARNDAAIAAVDADVAAALAYRPPARALSAPPGPTFPPLEGYPDHFGTPPGTRTGTQGNSVVLTCGTDLNPEPIRWLWPHWLALGKLHILAGAPGQGKTTLALDMAATITAGDRWPDGNRCDKGNILIWSGEDDPADTLLPRLLAAGADRGRCYFIEGARDEAGEVQPFDPSRDLQGLLLAIQQIGGIRLLVIDPVVSAVTGDSHKNTEVRRALQPLVNLATACDCAVLGITHFAKGGQGVDPAQRVVGSVAFTAVARVVMVAAKVKSMEDGQDARILARTKSNIGPDDGGFQYQLDQCEPLPGIQASRITWGKAMQGTARDLLTDPTEDDGEDKADATAKDVAAEFLVELLKDGSAPSKFVEAEAKAAGISWITVRRASDALGVRKRKLEGAWYWFKPEGPAAPDAQNSNLLIQDAQLAQSPKREQVEQHEQVARQDAQGAQRPSQGILGTFGASSEEAPAPKAGTREVL